MTPGELARRQLDGRLRALRRRLHEHPELGLALPQTQTTVLAGLAPLGLEITTGGTSTSVTAVLRGGGPVAGRRRVVLLRGDMDALPVHEETALPFRSRIDGVMHACGHDLHTAMLVGAAHLLAARRATLPTDVVLMFQPGEEGLDGAAHMIAEGVLDAAGPRPDAAYALHAIANLAPRGAVLWRAGPFMAGSGGLTVTVRGRGGHGASPHLTRDPIPAACAMVLALEHAVSREVDVFDHAVLTVGTFHAGTQRNVVPATATFEATVRTFETAVETRIRDLVERVCRGVAVAHGVEVDVTYRGEYPVTRNDAQEAHRLASVAAQVLGPGRVNPMANPIMGSEDFSRVLGEVPGAMAFLGACPPDRDPATAAGNHAPAAVFDDDVLLDGARLLAALADDPRPPRPSPEG